jgi:hypothetical protein
MSFGSAVAQGFTDRAPAWTGDWAWGLPLIVLTVIMHILGLGLINTRLALRWMKHGPHTTTVFVSAMSATTLLVACLHWIEAVVWAALYRFVGAVPDNRSAVLYSLNALTSYGHADVDLPWGWRLMGAMEALNGWLLFGLTTAFLFAVIREWLFQAPRAGQG